MSCSSCGSPASIVPCPRCSPAAPAVSGSTFDSWGSSSAEWEKATPAWSGLPVATSPAAGWAAGAAVATAPSWSATPEAVEPEIDGWGKAATAPSPIFAAKPAVSISDEHDGWNRRLVPPSKARPMPVEEDEEEGWLGSTRTATVGSSDRLQPVKPVAPAWEEEEVEEDSWLDADDDVDPELTSGYAPESLHAGSAGLVWVASAVVVVLIGLGAYTIKKPATLPSDAPTAAERASSSASESLLSGRGYVESGKTFLKSDGEAAAIQFAAAISALKAGGAAPAEIHTVRMLQAKAQVKAGQHEEAHKTWSTLVKVPTFKDEALKGVKHANRELRVVAAAHLENAEGALKAHEFKRAETLAREAARLFENHAGNNEQVGLAYGALGIAESRLGKISSAREHLGWALGLAPREPFRVAFDAVNPSGEAFDPGPAPSAVVTQAPPPSFSIDDDESEVPKGTVGIGMQAPPKPGPPPAVTSEPIKAPAKNPVGSLAKKTPPKDDGKKPGDEGVLDTYRRNNKLR